MDDEGKSPRVEVTDAWREEQRAKRDAYEAKRRAWTRMPEPAIEAEDVEVSAADGSATPGHTETGGSGIPGRRGPRSGTIRDPRQTRFRF
jgi:hypothetical protein